MATARWFSDLREAREAEILERLLHAVRDKQYDLPTLVGGLTAILELRSIQRKLDRAIDGRES